MNAVKSLKADWAIITLMIVVAVVMYPLLRAAHHPFAATAYR
ncbi:MAG: small membrane protein YkgR [Klebsiella michiganensis]|nr:small membrane protein YkgR [Klebsiella michiganensis]